MAKSPAAAARRTRTVQNAPATEPELPTPPPQPGSTLDFPLQVSRQPRAGISLNGIRLDHWMTSMEVTNNRYLSADGFRCTLALREKDPNYGLIAWSDVDKLDVEFFVGMGLESPPSTSILMGRVDEIELDLAGRTVSLSGRDYTADLIERQVAEKWPNKTSSEIVKILAGMVGLTPVVTETKTLAGTYYRAEHAQLADETTAWNLISFLAEREGFDAHVKGKELHFEPPPDLITAPRWTLQYEGPAENVRFARAPVSSLRLIKSLTVSRDIVVKVISWGSSKKKAITAISRSKRPARSSNGHGLGSAGGQSAAVTHVFRIPNLTQDQADARARQLAEDIAKHLRSFEAELPGDPTIDIRTIVTIRGTGGSFDTEYHLDVIQRGISQERGFTMSLRGRNIEADSETSI